MADSPGNSLIHAVIPAREGSAPHPGLLLLHGRGSNEHDLLSIGPYLDRRLTVVSARAPFTLAVGSYYWYDLEASLVGRPSKESIEYSLDLVAHLGGAMVSAHSVDPQWLFIGGFSMGAAMSAAAILTHPEQFAAAIMFSGYVPIHSNLPFRLEAMADHAIFQAHGTFDEVIPVDYGRQSRDFLQATAVDLTYREYPIAHQVAPEELDEAANWMRQILSSSQDGTQI